MTTSSRQATRSAQSCCPATTDYTIRPAPGAPLHLDTTKSTVTLPIVGGGDAFTSANG